MTTMRTFHPRSRATAAKIDHLILFSVLALALFAAFFTSCGTKEETGGGGTTAGDTTGITDTSIKVGSILPTSGIASIYGASFGRGMQAYFDWINDQGGIYGRKIELNIQDSQYSAPVATEAARYLIDKEKVFAFIGTIGDEVESAVKQMLDDQNIPDMFALAGGQQFVSPVQKNRFISQVTYLTEGRVLGTYLADNYAGKKVGILAQSDSYGKEGEAGIKQQLSDLNVNVETTTEYYDSSVTDVTSQLQRLKGANVDALVFFGGALPGASMIKTVRETLSWDVQLIMNEGSGAPAIVPLVGAENLVGIITVNIMSMADPSDTPEMLELKRIFNQYQPGYDWEKDTMASIGMTTAQSFVGLLKLTGRDLTRESFIAAAEHVCNYRPASFWMPQSTSPTDHSFVEAEIMTKGALNPDYDPSRDDPSRQMIFNPFGEMIDFESTPDCTPAKMPEGAKDQPGVDMGVY
jgi:branched-chain amino acid transport system substrate-binding protein